MSKKCQIKIYYKELKKSNVIGNASLFQFPEYDKLKDKILQKSKAAVYQNEMIFCKKY